MRLLAWIGCGLALLLLVPLRAEANPLDAYGFGAVGIGRAGAMTATVSDVSSNYYNPAGLAATDRLQLELGWARTRPRLKMNGHDQNVDAHYGLAAGISLPGRILGRRVAVSVGTFVPAERVSRIRALPQQQPRWALYDNEPQRIVITTSGAIEPFPGLTLGLGLTYLSNTEGTLDIMGDVSLNDADQTTLFAGVDVDLSAVRYLSAGIQYRLGDRWAFGVAFRDEFSLELNLVVDVQGRIFTGNPNSPLVIVPEGQLLFDSRNTNLFSPRQLAFGVAHLGRRGELALDVTWRQWSRLPPPTSTIRIDLDLGDNLPFAIPPLDRPLDPGFRDIWLVHAGGDLHVHKTAQTRWTLRGGAAWIPSPAPDQPGPTNYIDTPSVRLATGATLMLREVTPILPAPVYLDAALDTTRMITRRYHKPDPADPVGDLRAHGYFWSWSLHARLHF